MGDAEVGTVEDPGVIAIPLLPCASLEGVVSFYTALGFEVTERQERPNPYAVIRWRGADVHLYQVASHDVQQGNIGLLIVSEVEALHACFCDAVRCYLGRVPRNGLLAHHAHEAGPDAVHRRSTQRATPPFTYAAERRTPMTRPGACPPRCRTSGGRFEMPKSSETSRTTTSPPPES
jgi:hypothetical protein